MSLIVSGGEDPSSAAVSATNVEGIDVHDAIVTGNPVPDGGFASEDISLETDVAAGNMVRGLYTRKGARFIAGGVGVGDGISGTWTSAISEDDVERAAASGMYMVGPDTAADRVRGLGNALGAGLGILGIGARTPGSSEVKTLIIAIGATSAARATFLTPTSGKKIRVLSFRSSAQNLTTDPDEVQVYFGTGAAVTTNAASIVGIYDTGTDGTDGEHWADGEGPIGAADEVLSWRTETETETGLLGILSYREE